MIQLSSTFKTAYQAGAPQRIVLAFANGSIISNEDLIVDAGVSIHDAFCSETDLTIGLTPSAEISFELLNDRGQFDSFTFGRFTAYLGVRVSTASSDSNPSRPSYSISGSRFTCVYRYRQEVFEIVPLGVFSAIRPDVVQTYSISVTAQDQMQFFDVDMPDDDTLHVTYPIVASELLYRMCTYLGVSQVEHTFLNSNLSLPSRPDSFNTATMRQVLGWIAEAAGANARFNRTGSLELVWLNYTSKTFDEHDYSEMVNAWYTVQPIDNLTTRNADSTEEEVVGTGANVYLIQNNPFLRVNDTTTEYEAEWWEFYEEEFIEEKHSGGNSSNDGGEGGS